SAPWNRPIFFQKITPAGTQTAAKVPPPTDLLIYSYNFNTSFSWSYESLSPAPLFIVEIQRYEDGKFIQVSTCVKISQHYCDISKEIKDPALSRWVRVKALIGLDESEYAESKEFVLRRDGIIGSPTLHVSAEDDGIKVDIYHPITPYRRKYPLTVKANYSDFTYKVFFWKNKSSQQREKVEPDKCWKNSCSVTFPASSGFTYCVSAQGISPRYGVIGAESEKSCLHFPSKSELGLKNIILIIAIPVSIGLIITTFFICMQIKKRNIELPKSLVAVVRNLNLRNTFEAKPEAAYTTVRTLSIPASPVNGDENLVEKVDVVIEVGISNPDGCIDEQTIDSQETSRKSEEMPIQESMAEMTPGSGQSSNLKDNYFISESGQEELCSIPSEPGAPDTKVQPPAETKSCVIFSGYDKPHVPLHFLIDVGREDSALAYRHLDELGD
uniref:Interferon gamma receptor 1 n=1 Tax=Sphenodon punctatus TaxID=8508 RepID=A0A8D0H7M2_SPHPU